MALFNFEDLMRSEMWCGCEVYTLTAHYVCYPAFLEDRNDPLVMECTKCGATWLESDVPLLVEWMNGSHA